MRRVLPLAVVIVMAAGCGTSGEDSSPDPAPVDTTSTSTTLAPEDEAPAVAVVDQYLTLVADGDYAGACALTTVDGPTCSTDMAAITVTAGAAAGHAVVEGDDGLVTMVGEWCVEGECFTNEDPDASLPSDSDTLEEAITEATSENSNPALAVQRVDGTWLVSFG